MEEDQEFNSSRIISESESTPEERNFQVNILLDRVSQMNSANSLLRLFVNLFQEKWFTAKASHVLCVKKFVKNGIEMLFKKNVQELVGGLFHLKNSVSEQFKADLGAMLPQQMKIISDENEVLARTFNKQGETIRERVNQEYYNPYNLGKALDDFIFVTLTGMRIR